MVLLADSGKAVSPEGWSRTRSASKHWVNDTGGGGRHEYRRRTQYRTHEPDAAAGETPRAGGPGVLERAAPASSTPERRRSPQPLSAVAHDERQRRDSNILQRSPEGASCPGAVRRVRGGQKRGDRLGARREADGLRQPRRHQDATCVHPGTALKAADGPWQDIDTTIVADTRHPGVLRNRANAWTVRFAALPEGVTVETEEGQFNLSPSGTRRVKPTVEASDTVIYRDAWPGADLRYRVFAGEVKEDIVLRRRPDRTSFSFATGGRRFERDKDGSGGLVPGGARSLKVAPPEVLDRDGRPLPEARPTLEVGETDNGSSILVGVDREWVENLRAEQFPISVDPTFVVGSNVVGAYKSDGYSCSACGLRVGNSRDRQPNGSVADRVWRSVAYFDYSALYGKRIRSAAVSVGNRVTGTANAYPFYVFGATAWGFGGYGQFLGYTYAGNDGTVSSPELTSTYDTWAQQRQAGALMLVGYEAAGLYTYKQFHAYVLSLTWDNGDPLATSTPSPPPPPARSGSRAGRSTPTPRPRSR